MAVESYVKVILGKGKLTSQVVVRNTRLRLVFILVQFVFVQVKHQADLLDLGKNGRIKFQNKELFMYCPL